MKLDQHGEMFLFTYFLHEKKNAKSENKMKKNVPNLPSTENANFSEVKEILKNQDE